MEIFKSNKGGENVAFEGYTYITKHKGKNYFTWKCSIKNTTNCPGILRTSILKTDPSVTIEHNHPASQSKVNVMKTVSKMKLMAKTSSSNPVEIYAQGVSELDEFSKSKMPLEDTTKRTLRNQRSKNNPVDPVNINDLLIEGRLN